MSLECSLLFFVKVLTAICYISSEHCSLFLKFSGDLKHLYNVVIKIKNCLVKTFLNLQICKKKFQNIQFIAKKCLEVVSNPPITESEIFKAWRSVNCTFHAHRYVCNFPIMDSNVKIVWVTFFMNACILHFVLVTCLYIDYTLFMHKFLPHSLCPRQRDSSS